MSAGAIFVTGGSGMLGRRVVAALVSGGTRVRALARSERAAVTVTEAGAEPIRGSLADSEALHLGLQGCMSVVHCAARMEAGGRFREYFADNVTATQRLVDAAQASRVTRFVHLGAAMSLVGGPRIIWADESWPLQEPRYSGYVRSKTIADRAVRAAATDTLTTVVVRPAWVWGAPEDPQLLALVEATRAGRMRLIDHGRHQIVTSHIDNVVHAVRLALEHGKPATAYYVFDDGAVSIRDFLSGLLRTQGLELPEANIPGGIAWIAATAMDLGWSALRRPGSPPVSRLLVALNSAPFLVSDQLARDELGYRPVTTRAEGLARMAEEPGF